MMRWAIVTLVTVTVLFACRREKGGCPSDRICTMEFRTISVDVRDSTGATVVMDSVRTVRNSDGRVYRFEEWQEEPGGTYMVLTDNEMSEVDTRGVAFRFEGYLDGERRAAGDYLIRHDCCHVEKVSGPAVITVTP